MVNEIKSVIVKNTPILDKLISKNIASHTTRINATFQQKLEKFADVKNASNLDRAKFKVYAKINKDLCNDHNSDSVCKMSLNFYYPFLINLYALDENYADNNEKFKTAIHNFVNDIQAVIKQYNTSSLDYTQYNTKVS